GVDVQEVADQQRDNDSDNPSAANTAYADFPRLVGFIARDGFLPRKLANRGDTLVFNGGIVLLAGLASALIVIFRGSVHALIPLYAVGVFLAFTMSQSGMVIHWIRLSKKTGILPHWPVFINALGTFLSGIVLVVIAVTKFLGGAWIVTIVIPLLISYFLYVHAYYRRFRNRVESLLDEHLTIDDAIKVKVVLTIGGLSPIIDHSMKVARRITKDITAVYVAVEPEEGERIKRKWDVQRHGGVQLTVIPSPYRTVVGPLQEFLSKMHADNPGTLINLLVPVIVTNEPFDAYLHNGTANLIVRELRFTEGVLITVIPFYVNTRDAEDGVIAHSMTPAES
ncbi:MAG: amino acid permease, partial [Firmicutes bacterium]|nr:amino acid permease [Bacillota bacterium]